MQLAITLGSEVEFFEGYRDLISLTSSWIIKGLTFSHVFVEHYGVAAWPVLHSSSCFHCTLLPQAVLCNSRWCLGTSPRTVLCSCLHSMITTHLAVNMVLLSVSCNNP